MPRTAATTNTLQHIKDVDAETARTVRAIWRDYDRAAILGASTNASEADRASYRQHSTRHLRRLAVAQAVGAYGVEYLGTHKRTGSPVHYCNIGDPYATTILFIGSRLVVGCWADLIERNQVTEPSSI